MGCPLCLGTALSVFPGNALRFCSQSHMCGSGVFYFRFILGLGKKNHGKVAPEISGIHTLLSGFLNVSLRLPGTP